MDAFTAQRVVALAVFRADELGLARDCWHDSARKARSEASSAAAIDELVAIQIVRTLERAGIRSLVLKGSPLGDRLYGDVALRDASADLDILVPTHQLLDAAAVLETLGWAKPDDPLLRNGLPNYHLSMAGSGLTPTVELHWRVQWYESGPHATGLMERALEHRGLPVAEPVDLLGALLLMWARDGFHKLRLGADIAAWWERFGVEFECETERLWGLDVLGRPMTIAAQAAAAVLGTPPPSAPVTDGRARLAVGLALTDQITRRPRAVKMSQRALLDVLVCPRSLIGHQLRSTWLLDPALSRAAHPGVPSRLVPALRVASAGRTLAETVPMVARALRSRYAGQNAGGVCPAFRD